MGGRGSKSREGGRRPESQVEGCPSYGRERGDLSHGRDSRRLGGTVQVVDSERTSTVRPWSDPCPRDPRSGVR